MNKRTRHIAIAIALIAIVAYVLHRRKAAQS